MELSVILRPEALLFFDGVSTRRVPSTPYLTKCSTGRLDPRSRSALPKPDECIIIILVNFYLLRSCCYLLASFLSLFFFIYYYYSYSYYFIFIIINCLFYYYFFPLIYFRNSGLLLIFLLYYFNHLSFAVTAWPGQSCLKSRPLISSKTVKKDLEDLPHSSAILLPFFPPFPSSPHPTRIKPPLFLFLSFSPCEKWSFRENWNWAGPPQLSISSHFLFDITLPPRCSPLLCWRGSIVSAYNSSLYWEAGTLFTVSG